MDYGFDNIFAEGPTPTPGAMEPPLADIGELTDSQYLDLAQQDVDGRFSSMSNVDGMNVWIPGETYSNSYQCTKLDKINCKAVIAEFQLCDTRNTKDLL